MVAAHLPCPVSQTTISRCSPPLPHRLACSYASTTASRTVTATSVEGGAQARRREPPEQRRGAEAKAARRGQPARGAVPVRSCTGVLNRSALARPTRLGVLRLSGERGVRFPFICRQRRGRARRFAPRGVCGHNVMASGVDSGQAIEGATCVLDRPSLCVTCERGVCVSSGDVVPSD